MTQEELPCNRLISTHCGYNLDGVPTDSFPITRRSERKPVRIAVLLLVDSESEQVEQEASTLDLSQHGLRVQSKVMLCPGQLVQIIPNEGPEYAVLSRVVWVGPASSDQGGEAGLEFLNPLPAPV